MRRAPLWLVAIALTVILPVAGTTYYFSVGSRGRRELVVSTTTSLYDTGLLEPIEEAFEDAYPVDLHFISVGTGLAMQHARRGDADVILIHAPSKEEEFLKGGYGVCRKIIAYNFFVIIGPTTDPAAIRDLAVSEALTRIVNAGRSGNAIWVSRGDDSGTHIKEKQLWSSAGFSWTLLGEELWFLESGTGMGRTLLIANERDAYILADIGTYLKYFEGGLISLEVFVGEDKELLNVYSAVAVDPDKVSGVNFEDAVTFIKFLASNEAQESIENYQKDVYGRSLFHPAVNLLKEDTDPILTQWIREFAFFNGTECPTEYRRGHTELYG